MIVGGRSRGLRDAATTAALGCALGVGSKAIEGAASFGTGRGR